MLTYSGDYFDGGDPSQGEFTTTVGTSLVQPSMDVYSNDVDFGSGSVVVGQPDTYYDVFFGDDNATGTVDFTDAGTQLCAAAPIQQDFFGFNLDYAECNYTWQGTGSRDGHRGPISATPTTPLLHPRPGRSTSGSRPAPRQ